MANLKEIRVRISSVSSTRQITSAMKMVSAAKLRKAQDAILNLRPYAVKLDSVISRVAQGLNPSEFELIRENKVKKLLIVLISSDKGMCGAFNSTAIKAAISYADDNYPYLFSSGKVDFCCLGKKGAEIIKSKKLPYMDYSSKLSKLDHASVAPIAQELIEMYKQGKYDKIVIAYNQFKNAAVFEVQVEAFLPFPKPPKSFIKSKADYFYEPSQAVIVERTLPLSLEIKLLKTLLDSQAAEHGARMTAMHKATDNASDLIRSLTLTYNKARQATITNELVEIVGGAEALNG
jgi:F-type H+-transporting ATPase subunit gamma